MQQDDEYTQKLKSKLQKSQVYKQMFDDNEKSYSTRLQVAKFTKLDAIKQCPPAIFCGMKVIYFYQKGCSQGLSIFLVFAQLIPDANHKKDFESFSLYFVQHFEEHMDKPFILVFFNTNLMSSNKLGDFKEFYSSLPSKYYLFLREFIVLHANFLVKSAHFFSSSEQIKLLKKRSEFIDTLFQLSKKKWFYFDILQKLPEYIKSSDTSFKDIIKKQEQNKAYQKKGPNVLMDDDEDVDDFNKETKLLGQDLEKYEQNKFGIPLILDIMVQYFIQNQEYMLSEGIFRKTAASYEQKILEAALANKRLRFIQKIEDPNIVAGVFKQFFIQIPNPLFTVEIYEQIRRQTGGKFPQNSVSFLSDIVSSLPEINKRVLGFVLGFFKKINSYETHNLMGSYNMAVVFAPCFFRPISFNLEDLKMAGFFVHLLQEFIDLYQVVFPEYNYLEMLTKPIDQKRTSMITYQAEDFGNLNDFQDILPDTQGFDYLDMQSTQHNHAIIPNSQLGVIEGLQMIKQFTKEDIGSPKSSSRSSIGSNQQNIPDEEQYF